MYGDYRDLLGREDVDVVNILVPPSMNLAVVQAAVERSIDVICEKPIAATLEDAARIAAFGRPLRPKVLIAENFRYENAIRRARADR